MPRIRRLLRRTVANLRLLGFDPLQSLAFLRSSPRYLGELRRFRALSRRNPDLPPVSQLLPVLGDYRQQAGITRGHYFHQDLWAARRIFERRPPRHLDVGSRIDGFVAHLLVFMPVELVDIRPLTSDLPGLGFVQADATRMTALADHSVDSLSSLHAVEHFGLGRYGDPLAPDACFTAMRSFARVLKPGGRLYFSVPIGRERVVFNAHRVFAPQRIAAVFRDLRLLDFSAVDDQGLFHPQARLEDYAAADYSCGLFEFTRDQPS